MISKFFYFISVILIFTSNNFSLLAIENLSKSQSVSIPLDYLKKLPTNDYIIGPGDQLRIIVSRFYPELTTSTNVDGEGTINIPKLNRVFVNQLTISELSNILNKAYKEFVKYPSIEIEVIKYRPIKVFVKGEVVNPGLQNLTGAISVSDISGQSSTFVLNNDDIANANNKVIPQYFPTVFDAIRSAGGITQFTDLTEVKIIRKNSISDGGGRVETTLNFENVLLEGETSQNIRIYDSDVLIVKKADSSNPMLLQKAILSKLNSRFLNVFITGRVEIPGNTTVSRASCLTDAIDMAGGTKLLKGPIRFVRFNNDGSIDKRKFNLKKKASRGAYNNPFLRQGDLIIVGDSLLSSTNSIIKEFTAPFIGIFSTYGLIKAIQD